METGAELVDTRGRLIDLERCKQALLKRQAAATDAEAADSKVARLYPDLAGQWRDLLAELQATLTAGEPCATEAVTIVQDLTEKIVVIPDKHRHPGNKGEDPCGLELQGKPATLLAAAAPDPGALSGSRGLAMVAGEGLEPPTRGL